MLKLPKVISVVCGFFFVLAACKSNSGSREKYRPAKDSSADIQVPGGTNMAPATYKIFIENSGSMNGYVTVNSAFKNAVMGFITDLKTKDIASQLNIYYINKQICPQKENAQPNEIKYFFQNLNPVSFNASGCGTTTSYIPEIIKRVADSVKTDVNVLISDFIFSDSEGTSPAYLEAAQHTIKLYLAEALMSQNFATVIVKLNSNFDGKYYIESKRPAVADFSGHPISRPYYMVIFGKPAQLRPMLDKINFGQYKGYENSCYLFPPGKQSIDAKIVLNDKIGQFQASFPATNLMINHAAMGNDRNGEKVFQFSLAANLDHLKTDKNYLLDVSQYELPVNYRLVSVKETGPLAGPGLEGYTHLFTLQTTALQPDQDVYLRLKPRLPGWVEASSTNDDSNPADTLQQHKTFGFAYLVKGMSDAYTNHYADAAQFALKVKVSKDNAGGQGTRSGFPWWIIVAIVALLGVVFLLKRRS
ncbi:hypothetical protein SAMN04488128_1011550 [Chitinophaga eiseniae]|uniref:Uncharacterized protein n=1 Tax=Chitinophaga eiseniae TaxID=634771 RepID=A0A1T4NEK8_9BACT|nr:hypothetical protein [Chitinophaga eiseniae]SJZ77543.1 hypothetical protein SAMN04488128_1011550 [Chitinophaga eiseniae]